MKRTGKFYRKNEAEVMKSLGLEPTPNSGSGPIWKEDGQSEDVICQLKSTDAQSIRINKSDIDTLIYNAAVAHKLPVFAIQFLQSSEVYLLVRPEELCEAANYIKTGKYTTANEFVGIDLSEHENMTTSKSKVIKSSSKAREEFKRETEKRFKKEKRSAT
jgi:Holliday junction resolvase